MLHISHIRYRFDPRVADAVSIAEYRGQPQRGDVDILVDGDAQHGATASAKVLRIVGAAAKEADPERSPGNDHHAPTSGVANTARTPSSRPTLGCHPAAFRKTEESMLLYPTP